MVLGLESLQTELWEHVFGWYGVEQPDEEQSEEQSEDQSEEKKAQRKEEKRLVGLARVANKLSCISKTMRNIMDGEATDFLDELVQRKTARERKDRRRIEDAAREREVAGEWGWREALAQELVHVGLVGELLVGMEHVARCFGWTGFGGAVGYVEGHTLRNAPALRGAGLPLLAEWCGEEGEAAAEKPRTRKGRVCTKPLRFSDDQWSEPVVVRVVSPETRVEVTNFVISALVRAGYANVTIPPHLLNVTHLDSIIQAGRVGEEFRVKPIV